MENVRNFVIIAHIDHGKSTLADRFLELTKTVEKRKMREQYLDRMDLEREKGITIKMQPVQMMYHSPIFNSEYVLNLIDTPGHVDFTYEVSRSLAAVEGAVLLVDATQGVQAQTLANYKLAKAQNLAIIPVINKIDLDNARVAETEEQIIALCGAAKEEIIGISAKTGENVDRVLEEIVKKVPAPQARLEKPLRALIFDSIYDNHKGIIACVRIVDGEMRAGDFAYLMAAHNSFEVGEVGIFKPNFVKSEKLQSGDIGYVATGIKEPEKLRVGDTIIKLKTQSSKLKTSDFLNNGVESLPGYCEPKPMVFASIYPHSADDFELLKKSIQKLKLNDAALFYQPEFFQALGRGFSLGFLGMLHLEIVKERLSREYNLEVVLTTPSVSFKVLLIDGSSQDIFRAMDLPTPEKIEKILEPWVSLEILTPPQYFGDLMKLTDSYRLVFVASEYLGDLMIIRFEAPLMDIISDFYDKLKSVSSGYASMNYEVLEYRPGDLVKLEFLLAGDKFEAFSRIIPRQRIDRDARLVCQKLKELLPRENFQVAIQAAVAGRIVARETIPALKKDVTGYLYGGDRTRKMKLWKKQQRGKKKLKELGRVEVPSKVYLEILKL
ncbi:MAG TPA: translation elongation factor 4 [Candidatus Paceibacterota bacterium]|nr:translation elongation factor 4 [Candidatus Paceibacterota bacterium]